MRMLTRFWCRMKTYKPKHLLYLSAFLFILWIIQQKMLKNATSEHTEDLSIGKLHLQTSKKRSNLKNVNRLNVAIMKKLDTFNSSVQNQKNYFLNNQLEKMKYSSVHTPKKEMVNKQLGKIKYNKTIKVMDTSDFYTLANYKTDIETSYIVNLSMYDIQTVYKRQKPLEVIFLKHSHTDPGWLATADEYFETEVQYILDNMLEKLTAYHDLTFQWAETVYFSKWWNAQNDDAKMRVQKLINNGQLEMVTGGWVMPDEACTHYFALIDQLIEGHQWLYQNLKVKPKHNWSVDPFGHSATATYLWKLAGFESIVVQRLHQAVKNYLALHQNLQFYWKQAWDEDNKYNMLTYTDPWILYFTDDSCGPDKFICRSLDVLNHPEFLETMTDSESAKIYASELAQQLYKKAALYRHNSILIMIGNDFEGTQPKFWDTLYESYSILFDVLKNNPGHPVHARFGTMNDYHTTLLRHSKHLKNMGFDVIKGDFFPYSERDQELWTGYFTTKPISKRLTRILQENLRSANFLLLLSSIFNNELNFDRTSSGIFQEARRTMGLFQHHDAITGTSKQLVSDNYDALTNNSTVQTRAAMQEIVFKKFQIEGNELLTCRQSMFLTNMPLNRYMMLPSHKNLDTVFIVIYNPLMGKRTESITLLSHKKLLLISDTKNNIIPHEVVRSKTSIYEVSFLVTMPALSLNLYNITAQNYFELKPPLNTEKPPAVYLENACYKITFDSVTGLMASIYSKRENLIAPVSIEFELFDSVEMTGLYLLKMKPFKGGKLNKKTFQITYNKGDILSKVTTQYEDVYTHQVTLINDANEDEDCGGIRIDNTVEMENFINKELVMRIKTTVSNDNIFFIDSNGFQIVKRQRIKQLENAFYPMTTQAFIEDRQLRVTVHSNQALGAMSMESGSLEILLDRNVDMDDTKGAGEGVTRNKPAHSSFILQLEKKVKSVPNGIPLPSLASILHNSRLQSPLNLLPIACEYKKVNTYKFQIWQLQKDVPCDLDVVNLRHLYPDNKTAGVGVTLHRWKYDDSQFRTPKHCAKFNFRLCDILWYCPTEVKEMSLSFLHEIRSVDPSEPLQIQPMEIKSYFIPDGELKNAYLY